MSNSQLKLDFSSNPIFTGKKLDRITIPCSIEFRKFFDEVARLNNKTRAEFGYDALLQTMKEGVGTAFFLEQHADKIKKLIGK